LIVGSGLLANAFSAKFSESIDICIYASGVSNSGCKDRNQFLREKRMLSGYLDQWASAQVFVYFSTCSIEYSSFSNLDYIRHKIEMESLVAQHPSFVIARLPNVVGVSTNPHTILNDFYTKIISGEKIAIWKNATRSLIDVDDVAAIVAKIIEKPYLRNLIINIANPHSISIADIVKKMECILHKSAVVEELDQGMKCDIDLSLIMPILAELDITFDTQYSERVLIKYFGAGNR